MEGANTFANIFPEKFGSFIFIQVHPVYNMLYFDFVLAFPLINELGMEIILLDDAVGNVVLLKVEYFRAHQHHHLTPLPIHLAPFLMVHDGEQNSSRQNSIDLGKGRVEVMFPPVLLLNLE